MHILLTDRLTCPRCGPSFGLVLLTDRMEDRHVLGGSLGCFNCRESYPIVDGFCDLRPPPRDPLPAAESLAADPDAEESTRLAALLGLVEGGGSILLLGPTARYAAPLIGMVEGVEVVAASNELRVIPESAGVNRMAVSGVLPFKSGVLRGVALTGGEEGLLEEVVRVTAPIGRIVVLESTPETEARIRDLGLEVLIAEGEVVVARATSPGTG